MLGLILKTLMRALLIFFPVAFLSFGQSNNAASAGTGVIALLVFVIALILILWARSAAMSRKNETENRTGVEAIAGQKR